MTNFLLFLNSFVRIEVQTWNVAVRLMILWHSRSCYSALPRQQALDKQGLNVIGNLVCLRHLFTSTAMSNFIISVPYLKDFF